MRNFNNRPLSSPFNYSPTERAHFPSQTSSPMSAHFHPSPRSPAMASHFVMNSLGPSPFGYNSGVCSNPAFSPPPHYSFPPPPPPPSASPHYNAYHHLSFQQSPQAHHPPRPSNSPFRPNQSSFHTANSSQFQSPLSNFTPTDYSSYSNYSFNNNDSTCYSTPSFATGDGYNTSTCSQFDTTSNRRSYRGKGGGRHRGGGNWMSRALTDPWESMAPIETPDTHCLVAKPIAQRHTVLFPTTTTATDNDQSGTTKEQAPETETSPEPPCKRISNPVETSTGADLDSIDT